MGSQDWSTFTFQQMPVVSVLPLLTKWQNDAHIAQTVMLNHFLKKTEVNTIKPDAFIPVVSAEKSYVIRGESFRSEIFLAAYSSTADNIKMWVDAFFDEGTDNQLLSWEDLFEMRRFSSYITKESNVHDERLENHLSGIDRLMSSDRIRQEIFNFEHDLWSY